MHPACLLTSLAMVVIAAGCSDESVDAGTFSQPAEVPDGMVCADWIDLPDDIRLDYALYRLSELRANDGLEPDSQPPSRDQALLMRERMEDQCHQDTMDEAAVWRVAHDQYTIAYDSRVFLDE